MVPHKSHAPKADPGRSRPPKGNAPTQLSQRELDQLLFDAARMRAAHARRRSRA
jgi:hypothetical protein